jgi:acyl dehydratase
MALNYDEWMSMPVERLEQTYSERDTMLYALGVGVGSADPTDPAELAFCYERDLRALPTMAVVLANDIMRWSRPELGVNYALLLHGEVSLTVHKPLPVAGTVYSELRMSEIYDKGEKGALVYSVRELYDSRSRELLAAITDGWFLRGDRVIGGKKAGSPKPQPMPQREADMQVSLPGLLNQALIYRLSGDYNPLHVDPQRAAEAGFEKPILHGLCAYGMAGRTLVRALCDNDPRRFHRMDVRFTSPVYPGEPLAIHIWKDVPGQASFKVIATQRNTVVEDFGRFDYAPDPV